MLLYLYILKLMEQRFWDKVNKTSSCWFWTGAKRTGYGLYSKDGKWQSAHRVAYTELVGEITDGKEIDHLCMNRNCVNPEHLELVTHKVNTRRGPNTASWKNNPNVQSKVFLLYIHNPLFKGESKKSNLVNKLLDAYYENPSFIHNALNGVGGVWYGTESKHYSFKPEFVESIKSGKPIKTPKDEWVGPDTELMPLTGKTSMTKAELKQAMKDNPPQYKNIDKIIRSPKEEPFVSQTINLDTGKIIRSPKDAEKAIETVARVERHKQGKFGSDGIEVSYQKVKLCKIHGIPLDNRGKCLQKNCKYN